MGAGNKHDQLAIAGVGDVEPLAGGGAVEVGQDNGAFENFALLQVVRRQADAPGGGASGQCSHLSRIAAQRKRESFGHRLAGKIVFRGAEATHNRHDVNPAQRSADGADQILRTVADNGFEGYEYAQFIEFFRQMK